MILYNLLLQIPPAASDEYISNRVRNEESLMDGGLALTCFVDRSARRKEK